MSFGATNKTETANLKMSVPLLFISIYAALFALLFFAILLSNWLNIPVEHLTGDPARTFGAHPMTGFISHIGILFWCSTAVVCLYSSYLLKVTAGDYKDAFFLFCSGLITGFLLLDDLFMFHEAIFPWYLHIPQYLVYGGYALLIAAYFIYFRSEILNSEYMLLITAVIFFGLSIAGDFFLPQEGMAYLVEDGFKLFGIATWFIYFIRTSLHRTLQ